jgi:hypothetical protein
VVPGGGPLDEVEQSGLSLPALALLPVAVAQRHAGPAGEELHRPGEVEVFDLADERDGIAGGLAAEAVVEPVGVVDREAR